MKNEKTCALLTMYCIITFLLIVAALLFGTAKPNVVQNTEEITITTEEELTEVTIEQERKEIKIPDYMIKKMDGYKKAAIEAEERYQAEVEARRVEKEKQHTMMVATSPEPIPVAPATSTDAEGMTYVGYYQLTAYTHTGNPMANGQMPYIGAVACNSIPLGTVIYVEGYGTYTVCDTGGMGGSVVDIFMDTYDECIQFGRRGANVYIVN